MSTIIIWITDHCICILSYPSRGSGRHKDFTTAILKELRSCFDTATFEEIIKRYRNDVCGIFTAVAEGLFARKQDRSKLRSNVAQTSPNKLKHATSFGGMRLQFISAYCLGTLATK